MKLAIPVILTSVILMSAIFAFVPIQNASTVHTTIGNSAAVSELQKTLPAAGTNVDWTITCSDTGNVLSAVWADNSATDDLDDPDFALEAITIAGSTFKSNPLPVSPDDQNNAFTTNEEIFDILRLLEQGTGGGLFGVMPCPAGDTVVFTFSNDGSADDVLLNLIVAVDGPDGITLG